MNWRSNSHRKQRARELRSKQTKSEGLLWSLLRAKQVSGLKFRRQHPIGPFYADFACIGRMLVIDIDGGYHDSTAKSDFERESLIKKNGWEIVRFSDKDVEQDAEAVARGIARHVGLKYEFNQRKQSLSGKLAPKPSPLVPRDPPKGRVK